MEKLSNCEICRSSIKSIRFDCNHEICANCIHMPILTNYQKLKNLKDINENVTYECIICHKGNFSISNNDLVNFIESYSKDKSAKDSGICGKHLNTFKFLCKTCKCNLCLVCYDDHEDDHDIRNLKYFRINKINYCYEHKEKFNKICTPCNKIICNQCFKDSHNIHSIISNIDDYFKAVKNELKLLKMPNNINTIDDFIQKFNEEENTFLKQIKDDHVDIKKKISELINCLHSIEKHFDKLENDFKLNCKFMKQIFTNYYQDINKIEESDYLKLHYLNNLPKSFGEFTFKSNTNIQTFDTIFNTINNNVSKLKDDSDLILYTMNDNSNNINLIKNYNSKYECIQTLQGHTNSVWSLIQLQNEMMASGSDDKTIKIWDPKDNFKCVQTLQGHTDSVFSLIQLQNGMIASGSADQTIKIWEPNQNYKCIQTLQGHTIGVYSLIQLQNGMIALGSWDATIKICDPDQNFKCIQTLQGHNSEVSSLIQLQNGMIASGSTDQTLKIWDPKSIRE